MTGKRIQELIFKPFFLMLVISVIGAYLRLHDLTVRSLWYDEAVLYHIANNDFSKLIHMNAAYNSAPPLYALLIKFVMTFGNSEAILRSVSCVAGILSIPLIFHVGRLFVSPILALFPAILVALSPQQIYYSTQLREYSLSFFLAIWLIATFCFFIKGPTVLRTLHLGAAIAISICTQYGLGLLVAAFNIVCAVYLLKTSDNKKKDFSLWGAAQLGGILALYLVYMFGLKDQFSSGGFGAIYLAQGYGDGTLQGFLRLLGNTGDIFSFAFPTYFYPALCCLGILEALRTRDAKAWCALAFFFVPFMLVICMATLRWYPYLGGRQLIFLTPMTYLFAALGLGFLASPNKYLRFLQGLSFLLMVGIGFLSCLLFKNLPGTSVENLKPIVKELIKSVRPQDIVYVYYGATPAFRYYLGGAKLSWVEGIKSRDNPEQYFHQLDGLLNKQKRIWLIFSHVFMDEDDQILQYLQLKHKLFTAKEDNGAWLLVMEP